ncbi:MAG: hypothetical protein ABIP53_07610 [Candidatus Limnocylindrales bacterium]
MRRQWRFQLSQTAGALAAIATILVAFVAIATDRLADYPRLATDESWLMTVSHTFLTSGYLGADMFAGFFNADSHWFVNPPAQHFYHAASFALVGESVAAARLASVVAAVVLLLSATSLAWRWWGALAAVVTCLLLVLLPSGLTATVDVPLYDYARSARYDIAATALLWLALLLLHELLTAPSHLKALLLGLVCGLATLTQWFGIAAPVTVVVAWLWLVRRKDRLRADLLPGDRRARQIAVAAGIGFLIAIVPYAVYVVAFRDDAAAQISALHATRFRAINPVGVLENVLSEPRRYEALFEPRASGSWLFVAAIVPALVYLVYRARSSGEVGDGLALIALGVTFAVLALFDVTKAPIYALALVPAGALVLALGARDLLRYGRTMATARNRAAVAIVAVGVLAVVNLGIQSYDEQSRRAWAIEPYHQTEDRLQAAVPQTGIALGSIRWGWAFRDRPYAAELALWHWWQPGSTARRPPAESLALTLADAEITHVIVDSDLRESLGAYPEWLRDEFGRILAECATVVDSWTAGPYGSLEVYRLSDNYAACD